MGTRKWMAAAAISAASVLAASSADAQTASPVIWTGLVNVTTTGPNNNGLQKTGGFDQNADAGAYSQQSITSGDGYLEFTAANGTTDATIGFTTGSGAGTDYDFPWAIHLSTVGIAEIRENGGYVAEWTYATGDTFRIAIASGVVTYTHNGGAPHTSAVSPTYPVKVDSSISPRTSRSSFG